MRFSQIVAPSMKELFVNQLEDMILNGELKVGEKLPSERELAADMKISKTVVHEGIRELALCGFVDVISRKGVIVSDYTETGNINTLLAIMNRSAKNLDPHMICSLLDLRCYLECPAFELLSASHTDKDIRILEELRVQAEYAMMKGKDEFAFALYKFHKTVMKLSGNMITPLVTNALLPSVLHFWADYEQLWGQEAALDRLDRFISYIRDGQGKKASSLLREGIEEYRVGGYPLVEQPTSHTTVRTVRYTAVQ